jgi:hypothetical protein
VKVVHAKVEREVGLEAVGVAQILLVSECLRALSAGDLTDQRPSRIEPAAVVVGQGDIEGGLAVAEGNASVEVVGGEGRAGRDLG